MSLFRLRRCLPGVVLLGVAAFVVSSPAAAAPLDTNGARVPSLSWGPCPTDVPVPPDAAPLHRYECAVAEVPLSYRDPGGRRIQLAVGRLPAADQAHKIGTIFYNPGGPGQPGRIPPVLTPALHQRFDIVGFDPRGTWASTPLHCFQRPEEAEPLGRVLGQFPLTRAQERQQFQDTATVTELCGRNAGPLLNHVSTANVARDMDLLRAAVGDRQLTFFGYSYGSHIGTVYANLFPDRVRAVAIDAVDDPVAWTTGYGPAGGREPFSYRLGAHLGGRDALNTFLDMCAAEPRCAFREPGTDLHAKYDAILDRLQTGPVTITDTGAPTEVTYQNAVGEINNALEDEANAPTLARYLQLLHEAPDAAPHSAPQPDEPPAWYDAPVQGGAVVCADSTNPRNPHVWPRFARKADREARGFGPLLTYKSFPCATWPAADPDRYTGPWNRATANPLLLIANRLGDPATPYEGAQRTAKLLHSARLLTLEAYGHGARGKSECVDAALDRYFIDRRLPATGTVCQPDDDPFSSVPAGATGQGR